jgi:hypothetical protein
MSIIQMEWDATQAIDWFYRWFCFWYSPFTSNCLIHWSSLCENTSPEAIRFLEKHPEKIDWTTLSSNPEAIRFLEQNYDKIHWDTLSSNPKAIHLLEREIRTNPHNQVNCKKLSINSGAIPLLEKYPEYISWYDINENPNPEAMRLIESHWKAHSYISWYFLSKNPNIFTYDYDQMKENKHRLHEELIRNIFHPKNIESFSGWGFGCDIYTDEDL